MGAGVEMTVESDQSGAPGSALALRVRLLGPLAISRDGKSMLYVTYDQWGSDVHMLEGEW